MIRAALLLALVAGGGAHARSIEADEGVVASVEVGIFCTERTGERNPAPDTVSGFVEIVDEVELRARTLTVPASPDLSFGYRAQIAADAPDAVQILRHPPFRGIGATEQRTTAALRGGGERLALYTFDHPYERVEGTWSFDVVQGGRTLLSVVFEVVPASQAPHLVGLCAGPPMIGAAPAAPRPERILPTPRPAARLSAGPAARLSAGRDAAADGPRPPARRPPRSGPRARHA